ncbi:MAG: hypothetical protein ABIH23_14535 [bacterium]
MVSKVLVFCLLAATAFGQSEPIYPRLDSMQASVYAQLNVSASGTTGLTAVKLRYALNRSQAKIATDFPALEKVDTVILVRASEGGSLNSDFSRLLAVQKRRGDSLRYAMRIIPADSAHLLSPEKPQERGQVISPAYCWSYGKRFYTQPKVSIGADTFFVNYYALPPRMDSLNDTCLIPGEYLEQVIFYACGILSATRELFDEANWYLQWYEGMKQPPIPREAELKR